jgi:8-oxo-dGTP diphosphatase
MPASQFNLRVYGILIADDKRILVTEEFRMGRSIVKFPGGGLEFGEGTVDCLRREFREELNMDITVDSHFYTTDFFQVSAFNAKQQVVSIYYLVSPAGGAPDINTEALLQNEEGAQVFRWVAVPDLTIGYFTFPIDNKVAGMLIGSLGR